MSHQYRHFEVTTPAGTLKTAPLISDVSFPPFVVAGLTVRIPPGPNGVLGFQIASSRQQVIPWNAGIFIVANDELLTWPADQWPDSGDWQVISYNTGVYDHTVYLTFELHPTGADTPVPAPVPTLADLSAPGIPVLSTSDTTAIDQAIIDQINAGATGVP